MRVIYKKMVVIISYFIGIHTYCMSILFTLFFFIRTILIRTLRLRFAPDLRKCMGENKNILRLSQIVCVLIKKSVFTLSVDFVDLDLTLLQAYNPVETMAISSQVMNSQNYK